MDFHVVHSEQWSVAFDYGTNLLVITAKNGTDYYRSVFESSDTSVHKKCSVEMIGDRVCIMTATACFPLEPVN